MNDKELKAFVAAFLTLEKGTSALYTLTMDINKRLKLIEEKVELLEKSILTSDEIH